MGGKMNIVLAAVDEPLAQAWEQYCGDIEFVRVHRGSILNVECDAIVSPANSFGFMDGGIDLEYSRHFGWHIQHRLQEMIRDQHHGELLVGAAEIVMTDHEMIPYVIAAPTMRVPLIVNETVNPYLAARASLILIKHGVFMGGSLAGTKVSTVVETVAFPGLGTGTGEVSPDACARQMRAAIDGILLGKEIFPVTWQEARRLHHMLHRC
jgi:O-acetyl-ADP-ribose deacetylase (regulator of RNase III)